MERYFHSIFPVCVGAYNLNQYHETEHNNLIDLLLTKQEFVLENHGLIDNGYRSNTSNFLNLDSVQNLKQSIQNCVDDYCQQTGIVSSIIKHSWVVRYKQNGNIRSHRHELSTISGVFYPYVDDGSGDFVIENPCQPFKINEVSHTTTDYTKHFEYFPVQTGLLLIFPSWLMHFSTRNFSNERIAISFDCTVKE